MEQGTNFVSVALEQVLASFNLVENVSKVQLFCLGSVIVSSQLVFGFTALSRGIIDLRL